MKKALIGAILISLAFALPAFAAEGNEPQKAAGPRFEERKAEILKRIDERRACVQAANNHEDLKACMEKFGPHNPQGGPGGQGRMGGPG